MKPLDPKTKQMLEEYDLEMEVLVTMPWDEVVNRVFILFYQRMDILYELGAFEPQNIKAAKRLEKLVERYKDAAFIKANRGDPDVVDDGLPIIPRKVEEKWLKPKPVKEKVEEEIVPEKPIIRAEQLELF